MKPTFRVSLSASQVGDSQGNVPEHTIVPSILTDLIFRRNHRRRTALSGPPLNLRSSRTRAMRFKIQNRHNTIINFNIYFQSWILRIKDKIIVPIHKVHRSKKRDFHESNCVKFESWKHINTNENAYKPIQSWTKQYHPTPKPLRKSDHEEIQNFRRTSGKHFFWHVSY